MYAATMPATIWIMKRRMPRTIEMAPMRTMPTVTWIRQPLSGKLALVCMGEPCRALVAHGRIEQAPADPEEDPCIDGERETEAQAYV